MPYTATEKRQMKDIIEKMQKTEQMEVLKIIIDNGDRKFTENSNGCFINMSSLPDNTIGKLKEFIEFSIKNNRDLDKTEELLKELKNAG